MPQQHLDLTYVVAGAEVPGALHAPHRDQSRRLLAMDDRSVTFTYKDYAHGNRLRAMTLEGGEFLRRFLLHAVPPGFMRIRQFGLLANRVRTANLEQCRRLIAGTSALDVAERCVAPAVAVEPACCPDCGRGRLRRGRT